MNDVISGIEFIDDLKGDLTELGQHHKKIGVTKEMYDCFLITIVKTADISSGNTLTDKELSAWEEAFRKVCNIMLSTY